MYAFSGMVWWKEVSNTATIGTLSPKTERHARIAAACGGLCSGPSSLRSSMVFTTCSLISVETL